MAHEVSGTSLRAEDEDLLVLAVRFATAVERAVQLVKDRSVIVRTCVSGGQYHSQRHSFIPALVLKRGSVLELLISGASDPIYWCSWEVRVASELQRNVGLPADGIVGPHTQSFAERLYPLDVESMFEDWSSVHSLAAEVESTAEAQVAAEIARLKRNGPPRPPPVAPKPEVRPTRKIRIEPKEPK